MAFPLVVNSRWDTSNLGSMLFGNFFMSRRITTQREGPMISFLGIVDYSVDLFDDGGVVTEVVHCWLVQ